jgi:hypothetical protein
MRWISASKDNNKKVFWSSKCIFDISGSPPLFEGDCTCFAALKSAEVLPDLPEIAEQWRKEPWTAAMGR